MDADRNNGAGTGHTRRPSTFRPGNCDAWGAVRAEPGRLRSLTSFLWLPKSVAAS
jgi:hypothetical protein